MATSLPFTLPFLSLLLLFLVLAASSAAVNGEEYESNFCDRYVRYLGLTCREYQVTTVDGYILNFQRILNATAYNASISAAAAAAAATAATRAATAPTTNTPTTATTRSSSSPSSSFSTPYPVLLDHGLILGGELWFGLSNVTVDPIAYKRLPMILANRGMDVWVVNHRCTEYSPRHVTYTTQQWQYWDWDFDQLVQFDLPAVLRVITTVTASPKVHLVGYNQTISHVLRHNPTPSHSHPSTRPPLLSHQGGMLPFALASTYPEYTRQTVASVAAVAPIAYLVNITSPVLDAWANNWSPDIFFYQNHLLNGAYNLTATEVLVSTLRRVGFNFYTVFTPSGNVQDILSNVTGPICCMDPNAPPLALNPQWVATSYRALIHYQQEIRDRQFQLWDFLSAEANTANYGSSTPPLYYPSRLPTNIPVLIISGSNDWFADPPNVARLKSQLGTSRWLEHVEVPMYSHFDLIYGENVHNDVFAKVANFLEPAGK
ncbi:unnamed protein product [Closterium sp. Yama58-4]|nr:unnamed protein product [Closterium sp. Yama58-4]